MVLTGLDCLEHNTPERKPELFHLTAPEHLPDLTGPQHPCLSSPLKSKKDAQNSSQALP